MATTWYVIAHRAGARIVERRRGRELSLFEEVEHDRGRLKSGELDTDAAGSAFESSREGVRAMAKKQSAHERDAHDFARDLARGLQAARNDRSFDDLVLVAEPHFLGLLRRSLDVATSGRVRYTINRDLAHVPVRDLQRHIERAESR
ncbi:MAG: host attachment protein [Myxococcales bacterium]|nr:host attachment protein [Myxococcales bacterium]